MNKEEIIKEYNTFLRKHPMMPKDFILGAGGACVMYGIRNQTSDMDMAIPKVMFDKWVKSGKYKTHYFGTTLVVAYNANIDLHAIDHNYNTTIVGGVCCVSLEDLLKQKLELNREKDQADIKALRKMLGIK